MDNYKDLEEANKEVERSKVILHDAEDSTISKDNKNEERDENKKTEKVEEGSGIFTASNLLPSIIIGFLLLF